MRNLQLSGKLLVENRRMFFTNFPVTENIFASKDYFANSSSLLNALDIPPKPNKIIAQFVQIYEICESHHDIAFLTVLNELQFAIAKYVRRCREYVSAYVGSKWDYVDPKTTYRTT